MQSFYFVRKRTIVFIFKHYLIVLKLYITDNQYLNDLFLIGILFGCITDIQKL
ncbi:hypothetical protein E18064_60586 [Elizabethkingia anophelis]|nr:hypothetical protein E18064_60586 [Elizabethkingia anophelis]